MALEQHYSAQELEEITAKAEILRQEYPYSKSDVKETLNDLQIGEPYQELALTEHIKKREIIKTPKIKEPRKKSLESDILSDIIKEDLKKFGRGLKIAAKIITYPTLGNLVIPTMTRKSWEYEGDFAPVIPILLVGESALGYALSAISSGKFPDWVPYLLGAQLITNLGSGIYEYIRHVKGKVKEKIEYKKNSLEQISKT